MYRQCVGVDSSYREESPGGAFHSLDLLHETAGTQHTDCYLHTHKKIKDKVMCDLK